MSTKKMTSLPLQISDARWNYLLNLVLIVQRLLAKKVNSAFLVRIRFVHFVLIPFEIPLSQTMRQLEEFFWLELATSAGEGKLRLKTSLKKNRLLKIHRCCNACGDITTLMFYGTCGVCILFFFLVVYIPMPPQYPNSM